MTEINFKHRDYPTIYNGQQPGSNLVANFNTDGSFSVDYRTVEGNLVVDYATWTAADAKRLFERGMWVKIEPEEIKFVVAGDDEDEVYTATFDGDGDVIVSWTTGYSGHRSTNYSEASVRSNFADGSWMPVLPGSAPTSWAEYVDVPEPKPEPTDLEKARTLIKEHNIFVTLTGDKYEVHGSSIYNAKDDVELLKICQLLEELQQYE
jgi:hypothetical protein